MTGKEFSTIRRYNLITQKQVAKMLNYRSELPIHDIEYQEIVPERIIKILSDLCGLNFEDVQNEEWLKNYIDKIPERFKHRKNFDPQYAYNKNKIILNNLSMLRKRNRCC
ncbi:MAG TPA: hypothetical protein PKY56_07055 [Candidatus Kapabacteria bacterium]|nr:hypothetical protein [Candidatus Kapabacteria bacterium]HPO63385.1 hypothetical protein [Candidatus Kapabacteria bacterium]